jgi:hypothetical protein
MIGIVLIAILEPITTTVKIAGAAVAKKLWKNPNFLPIIEQIPGEGNYIGLKARAGQLLAEKTGKDFVFFWRKKILKNYKGRILVNSNKHSNFGFKILCTDL